MRFSTLMRVFTIGMISLSLFTVVTVTIMTVRNHNEPENISFGDGFDKRSIDDTPLMLITDKKTQCRYIYNTVTRRLNTAIGFDGCHLNSKQ